MAHTNRAFNHGQTMIRKTFTFRSDAFCSKQTWQHRYQFVWRQGSRRHFLACIYSNIHHRFAFLQQRLTTRNIINKRLRFREPRLVALEEKSDTIERHTWLSVEPGVVGIHMEEEAIHAQSEVTIQQCLDARRRLVPHATHLRKALCLHDILPIDVCTTDGIQHIVGFVMGRRVEPEFTHRHVHISIMCHSVADHRGGNTLAGELHSILLGLLGHSGEKHFINQFVDGLANVTQHLFTSHHRHSGIDG